MDGTFSPYQQIQMMDGVLSPVKEVPSITYITAAAFDAGSQTTTHSATGVSCGADFFHRLVVVAVNNTGNTVSSATLNGVAVLGIAGTVQAGTGTAQHWIWGTPTGTTVDISVTFGGSTRAAYAVYSLGGLQDFTPTLYAGTTSGTGGATREVDPVIPVTGVVSIQGTGNGVSSTTWTNATADSNDVAYELWDAFYASRDPRNWATGTTPAITCTNARSVEAAVWL